MSVGVPRVVASAEEWPEVPGARVIVQREGDLLPRGYWHVLSRVLRYGVSGRRRPGGMRSLTASGLFKTEPDGTYRDILLVAPLPSQRWWERYNDWRWKQVRR